MGCASSSRSHSRPYEYGGATQSSDDRGKAVNVITGPYDTAQLVATGAGAAVAWRGEAARRQESVLATLTNQARAKLSDVDVFCLDVLLPSVCSDNLGAVKAALGTLAAGGSHADASSAATAARRSSPRRLTPQRERQAAAAGEDDVTEQPLSDSERTRLQPYVNFVCPLSRLSLLFYAIMAGETGAGVVAELLRCGVSHGSPRSTVWGRASMTALRLAVLLHSHQTAELLVAAGERVSMRLWNFFWLWYCKSPGTCVPMLKALWNGGANPVPMEIAVKLVGVDTDVDAVLSRPGSTVWRFSGRAAVDISLAMMTRPAVRFLLGKEVLTDAGRISKALLIQSLLLRLCLSTDFRRQSIENASALLALLLEQGAAIHGWTPAHACAMLECWKLLVGHIGGPDSVQVCDRMSLEQVSSGNHGDKDEDQSDNEYVIADSSSWQGGTKKDVAASTAAYAYLMYWDLDDVHVCHGYEERHSRADPFSRLDYSSSAEHGHLSLLPVVLSYASVARCDDITQALHSRSAVSWLRDMAQIPASGELPDRYANGPVLWLHDGPRCRKVRDHCELSEEQTCVTLAMCTCIGGSLQSLKVLCREAILERCRRSATNILNPVKRLPLEPSAKAYLLSS